MQKGPLRSGRVRAPDWLERTDLQLQIPCCKPEAAETTTLNHNAGTAFPSPSPSPSPSPPSGSPSRYSSSPFCFFLFFFFFVFFLFFFFFFFVCFFVFRFSPFVYNHSKYITVIKVVTAVPWPSLLPGLLVCPAMLTRLVVIGSFSLLKVSTNTGPKIDP